LGIAENQRQPLVGPQSGFFQLNYITALEIQICKNTTFHGWAGAEFTVAGLSEYIAALGERVRPPY
jgi:hypothetical protein